MTTESHMSIVRDEEVRMLRSELDTAKLELFGLRLVATSEQQAMAQTFTDALRRIRNGETPE